MDKISGNLGKSWPKFNLVWFDKSITDLGEPLGTTPAVFFNIVQKGRGGDGAGVQAHVKKNGSIHKIDMKLAFSY